MSARRRDNRSRLIEATRSALGEAGLHEVTVANVSQRAGISSGFVHYYFGGKDGMLVASLSTLSEELRRRFAQEIRRAGSPLERIGSLVRAILCEDVFTPENCRIWAQFWGQAPFSPELERLERINMARTRSNFQHALRQLVPKSDAKQITDEIIVYLDGLWIRRALETSFVTPDWAINSAMSFLMSRLKEVAIRTGAASPDGPGTQF